MSGTITTAPVVVAPTTRTNPVVATAGATGVAAYVVTIIVWGCETHGIQVPTEVGIAMAGILTVCGHWAAWFLTREIPPKSILALAAPTPAVVNATAVPIVETKEIPTS